jgi:biopolymer transport protein TolR
MAAGVQKGGSRRAMSEINVTPFVDVMLVLLIIFMVTAPLLTVGVEVDLPETTANPIIGQDEPLAVSINAAGEIFLQDEQVVMADLVPTLERISERNFEARIFVRADRTVDYGTVMQAMGRMNRAGYTRIALVTEPLLEE